MRAFCLVPGPLAVPSLVVAGPAYTRLNAPGPHSVGFRLVEQYGYSRSIPMTIAFDAWLPRVARQA